MNEQNQNKPKQRPEEAPKNAMGEASAAKSSNGLKRLLSRKWVSPAVFMAAAAIIVTLMWIYQDAGNSKETATTETGQTETTKGGEQIATPDDKGLEAIRKGEKLAWPVANKDSLKIENQFYDENASSEEKAAAVMQVGDTFSAHLGIDFTDPNNQPFDVTAALSGKVTQVGTHPTNGNVVEISHGDGLVTVYQSLSNVKVEVGQEVKQGDVIAQAGRNDLERDLGVHVHFGVLENGKSVNPATAIGEQ
ncbi:peptidoglycan DD-metalloendopeptidase family protein [Paenibacillus sp. NPDC058071]|uniref:peptidoglycan DD-metalloendopeptidase family protein n=1 Tax=Paenibacillus sp. NPDC058071 TaxID=3346326 RepID=UPI0036DEEB56